MYDQEANPQDKITIERDGREFNLSREGENGFFYIKTAFKMPEKYLGAYTTQAEAEKAINTYMQEFSDLKKKKAA